MNKAKQTIRVMEFNQINEYVSLTAIIPFG